MLIGYARCSTDAQDLTAQRDALTALGVQPARIYTDHGLTGTSRARPGLREALAACRAGDTLVVTKLDRLARSLPDARDIADELTARKVKANPGRSIHDPTDPVGRLLFNVLAMVAEFESDLIRMRTREGMKVAKARGRLWGKQPKLTLKQEAHLVALHRAGEHTHRRAGRTLLRRPVHRLPGARTSSGPNDRPDPRPWVDQPFRQSAALGLVTVPLPAPNRHGTWRAWLQSASASPSRGPERAVPYPVSRTRQTRSS